MSKNRGRRNKNKRYKNSYNKRNKRIQKALEKQNKLEVDEFEASIINLDQEDLPDEPEEDVTETVEEKSGNSELTEEQQRILEAIDREIDIKARRSYDIVKSIGIRKTTNKLRNSYLQFCDYMCKDHYGRIKAVFLFGLLLVFTLYVKSTYVSIDSSLDNRECAKTYLTVNMYNDTNELHIVPSEINIKTQDGNYIGINYINWISQYLDTNSENYEIADTKYDIDKQLYLSRLILNDNIAYEEYKNSTDNGNKEFYLSSSKPSDIDTKGFKKVTAAFYEKATSMSVKAYTNSYYNTFLLMQETIGGGELTLKTLKHHIANIETSLYSSDNTDGIIINLEEYGELRLKDLLDLASVRYSSDNGIITVYDYEDNTEYFYISAIDNEVVGCNREDLLGTNSENIFLTYGFDKETDVNYQTFGVKTNNNLYVIKINPEVRDKVIEWFFKQTGENVDELEINSVQNVIYKGN